MKLAKGRSKGLQLCLFNDKIVLFKANSAKKKLLVIAALDLDKMSFNLENLEITTAETIVEEDKEGLYIK